MTKEEMSLNLLYMVDELHEKGDPKDKILIEHLWDSYMTVIKQMKEEKNFNP